MKFALTTPFSNDTLPFWQADAHAEAQIEPDPPRLVLRDKAVDAIHAISHSDTAYVFRRLTLTIVVRPLSGERTGLCIRQDGLGNLAFVTFPLQVRPTPNCESATAEPTDDGFVVITIVFVSRRPVISICTCQPTPKYLGLGEDKFEFIRLSVAVQNCDDWFNRVALPDKIALVDVGAAFGLQPCWLERLDHVRPILFEPNPAEAAPLAQQLSRIPGSIVAPTALADRNGANLLAVARYPGCTSLLEPNTDFLQSYQIARLFDIIERISVDCVRYDSLVELDAWFTPGPARLRALSDRQAAKLELIREAWGLT